MNFIFKIVKIIHLPVNIFNLPAEHCNIGLANLISGINELAMLDKKRNYSPEFKLNMIQAVKNGQFSAEKFTYILILLGKIALF